MAKINSDALQQVQAALRKYEEDVEGTALSDLTKRTYLLHARNIVRWLQGDFEPGSTLRNRPSIY